MPIHNGTEWKSEKAWWVKVGGEWKKSTTIWKKVSGVWEKMTLSVAGLVSTFAGSGTYGDSDGVGVIAEFSTPYDACEHDGYIYIAETNSNKIRRIEISTKTVSTFAGSGTAGDSDGVGVLAEFDAPAGIEYYDGNLYVSEFFGRRVRKIEISTKTVSTFAGSGTAGDSDGVGVLAEFDGPIGLCENSGNLYVCDRGNDTVRKIEISTKTVSTFAGSGVSDNNDGVGVLADIENPNDIIYNSGNLYVTSLTGSVILKIVESTASVTLFSGSGTAGTSDGPSNICEFRYPTNLSIYGSNLYVSDSLANNIRAVSLIDGSASTFAGSGTAGDSDGVGVLAEFDAPAGMITNNERLYICDSANNKIRSIVL